MVLEKSPILEVSHKNWKALKISLTFVVKDSPPQTPAQILKKVQNQLLWQKNCQTPIEAKPKEKNLLDLPTIWYS